jgi:hypothetical protein
MSRISNLENKYGSDLVKSALALSDPSKNGKYLAWVASQIHAGTPTDKVESCVVFFHNNRGRLAKKDIYQYTFDALSQEIQHIGKSKRAQEAEVSENTIKVYENNRWLVVMPQDKHGIIKYGKGTKWCLTQKDTAYWEEYTTTGDNDWAVGGSTSLPKFFIALDKKSPSNKIIFEALIGSNTRIPAGFRIWNAKDKELDYEVAAKAIGADWALIKAITVTSLDHEYPLQQVLSGKLSVEEGVKWICTQPTSTLAWLVENDDDNFSKQINKIFSVTKPDVVAGLSKLLAKALDEEVIEEKIPEESKFLKNKPLIMGTIEELIKLYVAKKPKKKNGKKLLGHSPGLSLLISALDENTKVMDLIFNTVATREWMVFYFEKSVLQSSQWTQTILHTDDEPHRRMAEFLIVNTAGKNDSNTFNTPRLWDILKDKDAAHLHKMVKKEIDKREPKKDARLARLETQLTQLSEEALAQLISNVPKLAEAVLAAKA